MQESSAEIRLFFRLFENTGPALNGAEVLAAYRAIAARLPGQARPGMARQVQSLLDLAEGHEALLLDAWGVLNCGADPVPGVAGHLAQVRRRGRQLRVVTNAAATDKAQAVAKFAALGYAFAPDEIISSRDAALDGLPPLDWAVMGAAEGIAGAVSLADDPRAYDRAGGFLLLSTATWSEARQTLLEASLSARPRPVIVGNPDLVSPEPRGFNIEPGAFAHRIWTRTGVEPMFHGKPYPSVFARALASLPGLSPDRIVMVGDTLHTDILGGAAAGLRTALVTGHGVLRGMDPGRAMAEAGIFPDFVMHTP